MNVDVGHVQGRDLFKKVSILNRHNYNDRYNDLFCHTKVGMAK